MFGLGWKRNAAEILARRRRFFRREMGDGVLATLPVRFDVEASWQAFERRWPQYSEGDTRPYPSNEEIWERSLIGLEARGQVEDDDLPVLYSTLDAGEGIVGGMFGGDIRFLHRPRGAAFSSTKTVLPEYAHLADLPMPAMRRAVGDIPLRLDITLPEFITRLRNHTLPPNAWYGVEGELSIDEANRLMDEVRAYRV